MTRAPQRPRWRVLLAAAALLPGPLGVGAAASGDAPAGSRLSPGERPVAMHGACVLHLESWEGRHDPESLRALHERLASLGASAVALSGFAWQDSLESTELRPWDGDPEAPGELRAAIRGAHAAGLSVLLKPHVEIGREGRRDESAWRGEIHFDEPAAARAWFRSYGDFMDELARIADEEDVELLAVGLELAGLSGAWPDEWRRLAARVRACHDGALTYCANWWGEMGEPEVRPFEHVDVLAVQAFQPLADDPRASDAELARGARRAVRSWKREAARWGRPLVVSEAGFRSSPSPWVRPWEWRGGPARPLDQLRAWRALLGAVEKEAGRPAPGGVPDPWLVGFFAWLYEAGSPSPGPDDAGFSLGGKPAERLLERAWRRWSQRSAGSRRPVEAGPGPDGESGR